MLIAALFLWGIVLAAADVDTFNDVQGSQYPDSPDGSEVVTDEVVLQDPIDTFWGYVLKPSAEVVTGTGFLGTERDVVITKTSQGSGNAYLYLNRDQDGELEFTMDSGVRAIMQMQWDGEDGDAYSVDEDGLGGVDLTESGANDGIELAILNNDNASRMTFYAYTDASNWASQTIELPRVPSGDRIALFFPFEDFGGGEGTLDFEDLGALVMEVEAVDDDLQFVADFVESNARRDYGDLPTTDIAGSAGFATSVLSASHRPAGLMLGNNVDIESTFEADIDCMGDDDNDADDEDGVLGFNDENDPWDPGADGGELRLTWVGCENAGSCYVNGWIDWNQDGDFDDTVNGASEHIIANKAYTGTRAEDKTNELFEFDTPTSGLTNTETTKTYYARFRICEGKNDCDDYDNTDTDVKNGEIEDYRFSIEPTAVELAAFAATWADDGAVDVTWRTTLEQDTAGFNVWRSAGADGKYVQVNDSLIASASPGSLEGGRYRFVDEQVGAGTTYAYKLEEIEYGGARNWYGPTVTEGEVGREPTAVGLAGVQARNGAWLSLAGVLGAAAAAVVWGTERHRS